MFFTLLTLYCLTIYITPSVIAFARGHRNFIPIMIVNCVLGFTGFGYLGALAWSFSSNISKNRTKLEDLQILAIYISLLVLPAIFTIIYLYIL